MHRFLCTCAVKESREVLFTQFRLRDILKGICLSSFHCPLRIAELNSPEIYCCCCGTNAPLRIAELNSPEVYCCCCVSDFPQEVE